MTYGLGGDVFGGQCDLNPTRREMGPEKPKTQEPVAPKTTDQQEEGK